MKQIKKTQQISKDEASLSQVADHLVLATKEVMRTAKTEEDLRIGFEKALGPILESVGIESKPKYERLGDMARAIYKGRPDAVHGQVIIEYEKPASFSSRPKIDHAYDQLIGYMTAEAEASKNNALALLKKLVGVGFDGEQIFFVQYRAKHNGNGKVNPGNFVIEGPYPFESESSRTFLTHLRSLARLPLTAEHLSDTFGPKSALAPLVVSAFADALENWGTERKYIFFNEWKRLFGIVYGEQFTEFQKEEANRLAQLYGVGGEIDFQGLLFSVHTYFALLMKLIAAELITLRDTPFASSFTLRLTHAPKKELHDLLADIEDGGIYAKKGITNFLEGDFFRWYLDAFDSPRLEEALRETARGLADFEPATTAIDPDATRDLLKKLYQYLVPQEVRHKLGEYYTPDWLAELLLNETGYDGNTLKRFLDPSCGSGTFLVLAIQRAKAYGQKNGEPPLETAKRIVANIWGFDLNPLAVIASRTNYLFALGDLATELADMEIPIYLADSVLWPESSGQMLLRPKGEEAVEIRTSIKTFLVPKIWVEDQGFLMRDAAPLIEAMARDNYSPAEAMKRLRAEGLVFPPYEHVVNDFYTDIYELEKQGKNGIWARFLKNAFAPMSAGRFDFVIGNPPWIRWDFLSQEYRAATLPLWKDYGLFSLKGFASRLGGAKKDFSMLFTYAAADYYLKDGAKLGFLITQEVFKSKGAGEGFRQFQLGPNGKPLKVLKAHDLVTIQPFEGAANKTGAIILRKGEQTTYPVPYYVWQKNKGVGKLSTDKTFEEVKPCLKRVKLSAQPMGRISGAWQTIGQNHEDLSQIAGENPYQARSGAYTSPYGAFWLAVNEVLSDGKLLISNLAEKGKRSIPAISATIEGDLVFPAIRGADIERWGAQCRIYVLITQDPRKRAGFDEGLMKQKWPHTYAYLLPFKEYLISQAAYKKYHEESGNPFYSQYNIAPYTFAPYKVIWKQMTNDIFASVISQFRTEFGYRAIVPLHTTALFATSSADEAHYLCAVINSKIVRMFIKSFSSAGRGFGTPSVMKHVGIPKFNPNNELHRRLAEISKTLHDLKAQGEEEKIPALEKQNDELVEQLFSGAKNLQV